MKKLIVFWLFAVGVWAATAQTPAQVAVDSAPSVSAAVDIERTRISSERSRLEAGFAAEESACYKKFLVYRCLDDVKPRRREAMGNLKRQEISIDELDRRAKGAEQIRKTEEKVSPEKQQEAASRRTDSLKDFQERMDRDKQKNTERATAQSNEKSNIDAAANRTKNSQEKAGGRAGKQASSSEEVRKFTERQQKAKERQARYARDKLEQTKPAAAPLPVPLN